MNCSTCFPVIVEDDDDFALLLHRAFQKAGVPQGNVRRYRDGEGVLRDLLSGGMAQPSLLTLDVDLPGMSGLSVLKQIRSSGLSADPPAFFISGKEDPGLMASAYELQAKGYWVKPDSLQELQRIVNGMLESLENPGPRE